MGVARRLRFIPDGGALVEVTCRTIHGRFLLKPSTRLNQIIAGLLARAQRLYPVDIHGYVFLSNHFHLLVSVPHAERLAQFMGYLNGNLAREAGRLAKWRERFWSRRYQAIVVSQEDAAQISRLRYILAHGVKEGLVRKVLEWPGLHSAGPLLSGKSVKGVWVDRTALFRSGHRAGRVGEKEFETQEIFALAPLPCWSHLPLRIWREYVSELTSEIETQARHARHVGRAKTMVKPDHDRARGLRRSPAPYFHCASERVRQELLNAYRWFLVSYRQATERLKRGDPDAGFPEGSFLPPLPLSRFTAS